MKNTKIPDEIIDIGHLINCLTTHGFYEVNGFGRWDMLPRKKGKTFCGFRNKEGAPQYQTRVRFTINRKLRAKICK